MANILLDRLNKAYFISGQGGRSSGLYHQASCQDSSGGETSRLSGGYRQSNYGHHHQLDSINPVMMNGGPPQPPPPDMVMNHHQVFTSTMREF